MKDPVYKNTDNLSTNEINKESNKTEIVNFLLTLTKSENYLELGVRNPGENFNKIIGKNKFSKDLGVEYKKNPVTFNLTSDDFYSQLENNDLSIKNNILFDVIFIDGLYISTQVEKDIENSIKYLTDDGFLILHDCNPPPEYHQRKDYYYFNSPARYIWNGTTWKAFYKSRTNKNNFSICFDADWGLVVISKKMYPEFNNLDKLDNYFFEYSVLEKNRVKQLNLFSFVKSKNIIK